MFSTKSEAIGLYQFFFEKLFFSNCLFEREETQTSWSELSLWHRQTVHIPVVSFSFALFFLNISEVVKKCLEYWKKALLLILLAKTFANFAFDLLSVGKIYPSPQICFTILRRKKKELCRKWFEEKKNSILLPQNACVKIFVHKDFFCFLKGILCVFITASWRRIDRADFEQIIDQTKFLAFLERKHNNP